MVIGGTGACGLFVVRELIEKHGERPVVFDLRPDFTYLSDLQTKFDFVQGDITTITKIAEAVKQHKVDRILSLAAYLTMHERANPVTSFQVNAVGTQNILEVARMFDVKRVVYNSSKGALGKVGDEHGAPDWKPVPEDYPRRPFNLYGVGKMASEGLID